MIYITQISNSVNANGGYPGFSCELFDCGNSMECIAVEIYFVSAGDTQNVITQFIREQRNIGIPHTLIGKLSFKLGTHTGNRGKMSLFVSRLLFIKVLS